MRRIRLPGKIRVRRYLFVLIGLFTCLLPVGNSQVAVPSTQTVSAHSALASSLSTPTNGDSPNQASVPQYTSTGQGGQYAQNGWLSYLMDEGRSGFNSAETLINPTTAPSLVQDWVFHANGAISVQPVEANGLTYWGSWDGIEHATDLSGNEIWAVNLNQTTDADCDPSTVGVASTAAVASVEINGLSTSVVFVGGGDATFYALDAFTGQIIWSTQLGSSPEHFIWSSPLVYQGSVYIGVASFGDCPLVQGQLIQLDAVTGAVQHIFNVVPDGCVGGGVWSSPTIDSLASELYIATGNAETCTLAENYGSSVVELHAADLTYVSSWQVPVEDCPEDCDFGATPTLFSATIHGKAYALVGVAHKNGLYYAFERGHVSNGPIWSVGVAIGGSSPDYGEGSISPSAWDGTRLYVAGGETYVNGNDCPGSVRAIDPATGAYIWEHCLEDGFVLAPVSVIPGVVIVEEGPSLNMIDAKTGKTLFTFSDSNSGSMFDGAASVVDGILYVGNIDGNLYAFDLPGSKPRTSAPSSIR